MKYLVTVADDFGLCHGVNQGCLEAHQRGFVTELSLMVNFPGTQEAVALAKESEIESIGIHLTLNNFNQTNQYFRTADYRRILIEESAEKLQILAKKELETFEQLMGRPPSHITSHQHTQQHPKLVKMIAAYAVKHHLYVRRAADFSYEENPVGDIKKANKEYLRLGVKFPDYFFGHVQGKYEEVKTSFLEELRTVEDNSITELMFHPGFIDEFLATHSTMTKARERDVRLTKDRGFHKKIKEMGFKIVRFSEIG
ncbi:ChbG/HpnK family deacetylase [Patescibacteria group bacterium]|nr:ChbG/HpnK family deacetylase [Patescibacteria group bacterium]MBU1966879.1 ChbG/HpnK family deacetylase [Patescibacteria group bacterium]MBU2543217.1 ChbG/HpnK family deacetylase [Patescibacteria group bacterium]